MKENGISSTTVLAFLVFLTLKLCHVIDWSWWWITAPLWGLVLLQITAIVIYIICTKIQNKRNTKKQ